ncbi:fructose-1-phosphate kinase [Caloramator quimbayensis]|uniref:Tagatose-6-phosphate kinase n=1 Tax=Caloramator quimbayensis TaxID=1147123 RepID=A0A1T4XX60_9CLOT|nr:1-phosphofructokinase [Caloramator quimbayensis]SKA94120.1 fructose-1-phosphate kinase [Caloramator quimbayensis]
MIKTVTLNPAVDKTVEIDNFKVDSVNRIKSMRLDAGGKGINVSKVIKVLGGHSIATGFLAGRNGNFIKEYLDGYDIDNDFLFVKGETRTNLKVVDKLNGTNTDINETGSEINSDDLIKLEDKIFQDMSEGAILVLAGSVPMNVQKDVYRRWIERAKNIKAKVLLDADGELLKEGIKAGPYLIKPNIHELEKLLDKKLSSINDVTIAARELLGFGIEVVVVSLGEDGALFVTRDKAIKAKGISVEIKSTVGAGDSMVASLAFALKRGYSLEKAAALSVAAATANVASEGTQPPKIEEILKYEKMVEINDLEV